MAFFYDQRQRLLREEAWEAPALAEEIFAMMSPDVPMNTNSPVSINLPTEASVAPIQIGSFTDGGPVISFKGRDGTFLGNIVFNSGLSPGDGSTGPSGGFSNGGFGLQFQSPSGDLSDLSGSGGGGTSVPVWG